MTSLIRTLCLVVMTIVVVLLTVTSLPSFGADHLGGTPLMLHMMASGVLVGVLPITAWLCIGDLFASQQRAGLARIGYWLTMVTGWLSIATVFACMLPIMGTDAMHKTINVHAYAGFAMVPAVALLWIGLVGRRMLSSRASKPG